MGMNALEVRRRVMLAQPHEAVAVGAVASFRTDVLSPLKMGFDLVPIQDLHGQANPYPPGGGKNLLKPTASSTTESQVTFTVNSDGTVNTSGTASDVALLIVGEIAVKNGVSYIVNGLPSAGSNTTFSFQIMRGGQAIKGITLAGGASYTAEADETLYLRLVIRSGYNASGLKFSPMVRLGSIADGTFAPYENICPISGHDGFTRYRTGKNLFNGTRNAGYIDDNGVVGVDGYNCHSDYIKVNASTTYTYSLMSNNTSTANRRVHAYDANKNWIGMLYKNAWGTKGAKTCTFTTPANCMYIRVQFYGDGSGSKSDQDIQIESGSSASVYQAYSGHSYETEFDTPPGTVYGCHVVDNGDGTGTLTVDTVFAEFDGSEDEQWSRHSGSSSSRDYFRIKVGAKGSVIDSNSISNLYPMVSITGSTSLIGMNCVNSNGANAAAVFVRPDDVANTDLTEFKALLSSNPLQVVYKLTTPQTYTLSMTAIQPLIGQNNVWVDNADSVSVEYWGH